MNIDEKHRLKAAEIKIMLSKLEPQVLYCLADFMDIEPWADDGMHSQCVYEAFERADVHSGDGTRQKFDLCMGMSLPRIKVVCNFQDIGDGDFETGNAEIEE